MSTTLRPLVADDVERWYEVLADPVRLSWGTPAFVRPPASAHALLADVERARAAYDAREPTTLAVVDDAAPGRLLGDLAWRYDVPAPLRVADIGYSVHPDSRRRGVATAAIRAAVAWLAADPAGPRVARVQLDHSVENVASCRAALGAGLEREGVRRGFLPLRDPAAPDGVRRHDVCLHGLPVGG